MTAGITRSKGKPVRGLPMTLYVSNDVVEVRGTGKVEPPTWPEEDAARMLLSHADLLAACRAALASLQIARQDAADLGGPDCEEAAYFDDPIETVARAVRLALTGNP